MDATTTPKPAGGSLLTVLFAEIEGGARLWERDAAAMPEALARLDAACRAAVDEQGGTVVKCNEGALLAVFDDAAAALRAAVALQTEATEAAGALALRLRCGLHAGRPERRDNDVFGPDVNRAARLMGIAHGGQVLVSGALAELLAPASDIALQALGRVRLRGLATPEPVHQLLHPDLRRDFPALGSLETAPSNLPQTEAAFVGRARERAELADLLGRTRLVTLLGAVGMGKTRLALQVAEDVRPRFADGVWLVEFDAVADPAAMEAAVAAALRLAPEPGKSAGRALADHLAGRTMLLLFDRCGHLIDGAARLSDALLRAAPQLRIVVTSREAMRVDGELAYPLQPLPVPAAAAPPTAQEAARCDAVALFVDRARRIQPAFALTDGNAPAVADICARLDGIPLAIEFAAARLADMAVEDIDTRLRERMALPATEDRLALPELQTLRRLLDRSYDRLDEAEQRLFNRLSVFAGGFDLDAAEQVCGAPPLAPEDVLDLLTALIDRSLVAVDDGGAGTRYRLYEILRDYARERARDSDEALADLAQASERHAGHYAQRADNAADGERRNVEAALAWASKRDESPELVRTLEAALGQDA